MEKVDAVKKVLKMYGETDRYVSQRFYQSLCLEALEAIEKIEKILTECQLIIINASGGPCE